LNEIQRGTHSLKITIITVAFNSAATIVETLESVARQTHANVEHIVIDGGSTDNTLALIATHGNRVSHLVSEPDRGIYDAMNKGLKLASGDLVGFLNSDDSYASADVLAQIARIATAQHADVLFGDLVYVDPTRSKPLVRYWRAGSFSIGKLRLGWMPPHPTLYVRRAAMARVGLFDASLRIAADYEFILRLLGHPGVKVAYIPQVLVKMRIGGASNQSIAAMMRKSKEDLAALRKHKVGGLTALLFKNLRKLPQFLMRPQG
jgi:glycosyltransferase